MSVLNENQLLGSSGAGGDYNLENSLRFRSSASAYLSRTFPTAGNRKTWTWSGWVKIGTLPETPNIFGSWVGSAAGGYAAFRITSSNFNIFGSPDGGSSSISWSSSAVYRDPSAWYHIVAVLDTTQATAGDRFKLYVNGVQQTGAFSTTPGLNADIEINRAASHYIGAQNTGSPSVFMDGYQTEVNFVDGQALTPSDFGEYNATTGVWQPIEYTGTYGTNGFYLPFKPTTQATGFNTVTYTGNGSTNAITGVGFSPDFVWGKNRSAVASHNLLDSVRGTTKRLFSNSTEAEVTTATSLTSFDSDGFTLGSDAGLNTNTNTYVAWCWDAGSDSSYGIHYNNASSSGVTLPSGGFGSGDFTLEYYVRHHSFQDYDTHFTITRGTTGFNVGSDGSRDLVWADNVGGSLSRKIEVIGAFELNKWHHVAFVRASGVLKAYLDGTQVGSSFSTTQDYSATGCTIGALSPSIEPSHIDLSNLRVVVGTAVYTSNFTPPTSDLTNISGTILLTAQDSTIKDNSSNNLTITTTSGSPSATQTFPYIQDNNTDGTITSSVRANPATGFSVVTWTGNGTAGATVGHGLETAPSMIIVKDKSLARNWLVYHSAMGATKGTELNLTNGFATYTQYWNDTAPTSSVFSTGIWANENASNYVTYCFSEVAGYSKFGSYTGNGSTSGPTITTGFRPAFVLIKKSSSSGTNWMMYDNTRNVANPANNVLTANTSNAEVTSTNQIDFNSDGFQITGSSGGVNTSGDTYIYMAFADTRDAQFNFDASGNKNNWTANNINSNASGDTTYDIMTDVPTLTDEDTANYAVLNPINKTGGTLSQANLYYYGGAGPTSYVAMSTIGMTEGKFYAEWLFESGTYSDVGLCKANVNLSNYLGGDANGWMYYNGDGNKYTNGAAVAYGATYTSGDIIGIAFDADIGTLTFYKNGVSQGAAFTGLTDGPYFFAIGSFTTYGYFNFGQRPFAYTPPTGYLKLNTFNLPDSSIEDGSEYFDTVLYTGNGGTNTITGVGFEPDFVWAKSRAVEHNCLFDSVRGIYKLLYSNLTNAEDNATTSLLSFDSDGFTLGSNTTPNTNGNAHVAWNWKAGGTAVSNTDGTITSQVSANPTAGFSVVTFTGNSLAGATVGHGLGVAPKMVILKNLAVDNWIVHNNNLPAGQVLLLNGTNAAFTSATSITTSATTLNLTNSSAYYATGKDFVSYVFAEVEGFSKFGSYTGNGSTDGPFVYTGFRPAYIMIKRTNGVANWVVLDATRDSYNVGGLELFPNTSGAENNNSPEIDFLSNGVKLRWTYSGTNASGGTYIYMAFAENPFKNSLAR